MTGMLRRSSHSGRLQVAAALRLILPGAGLLLLAGCQGVTGNSLTPRVRIVHAAAGTSTVDVYQGSGSVAYNLAYGNVTSYITVASGTDDFSAITSGTHEVLATTRATFTAHGSYTILIGSSATGPREMLLKDQATPVAVGRAALRVVHQAASAGPMDVYLLPAGQAVSAAAAVLGNVSAGSSSGYLNVPAGGYKMVFYPSGLLPGSGTPVAYTGALTTFGSGSAHTMVLLDGKNGSGTSIQTIALTDIDTTN